MHTRLPVAVALAASLVAAGRPAAARFSPALVSVSAGGGVTDFRAGEYRANTDVGGAWDVAAMIGTRSPIAFELAYAGTAQQIIDPLGSTGLVSNSFEARGRFNLFSRHRVQPFVVGGLGYINFHTTGSDSFMNSMFARSTDALVVPVGAGLTTYIGSHGLVDARFQYRFVPRSTMSNDLLLTTEARPDDWTVMLRGGYAF